MNHQMRLVYASRCATAPHAQHLGPDPGAARILAKSRKNNARLDVVGGLLFGDGCFLQCLEGDARIVQNLDSKFEPDPRHCVQIDEAVRVMRDADGAVDSVPSELQALPPEPDPVAQPTRRTSRSDAAPRKSSNTPAAAALGSPALVTVVVGVALVCLAALAFMQLR